MQASFRARGNSTRIRQPRNGQALVEFGIIAFVLSAMVAGLLGIMVLALGSFQNNISAESAGRLLDERLVAGLTTPQQVFDQLATDNLYDETKLILSRNDYFDSASRASLPEINRLLLPSFIYDPDREVFRYPGAVVQRNSDSALTVLVPLLPDASLGATKGIDRAFGVDSSSVPVSDDWVGPVSISGTSSNDVYRIVIFYPSQPGSTINIEVVRDAEGRIVSQTPVEADDSSLSLSAMPGGYSAAPPATEKAFASSSRGQFGLGETNAFLTQVRPFRIVFESSSVFRLSP